MFKFFFRALYHLPRFKLLLHLVYRLQHYFSSREAHTAISSPSLKAALARATFKKSAQNIFV